MSAKDSQKSRPISPHLSIYKFQISSVLSIGHRMSGIGLFVALAAMCWWFILWVFTDFEPCYLEMLGNNWVRAFFFLVIYGFSYHLCTGIRHLIWDTGHGLSKCAINFSGWLVIFSSIVLTAIFWFYVLGVRWWL